MDTTYRYLDGRGASESLAGGGRWTRSARIVAVLLAASAAVAVAQTGQCARGTAPYGSLGIGEFHCVGGSCAVNMRSGDPYAHSFSTEPRLRRIDPRGPGRNVLRDGDVLVAVDGTLITTAEGGRKLGSIKAGDDVKLTLRRNGREIDAWLTAVASCDLPRLAVTSGTGFDFLVGPSGYRTLYSDSTFADTWVMTDSAFSSALVLGQDGAGWNVMPDSAWSRSFYTLADSSGLAMGIVSGLPFGVSDDAFADGQAFLYSGSRSGGRPPVEFGVELSCGDCGWRGSGPLAVFRTSEFPVIESVEKDGPADRAGLLPGDMLYSVEGSPITSRDAGQTLGGLTPGDAVTLEIRRGDRILEVSITPREASGRRQRM